MDSTYTEYMASLPPLLTRQELIDRVFRGVKLVQRMQAAGWLVPVEHGTRESYFWRDEAQEALIRIRSGELPPRLPSEPAKVLRA